MLPFAALSNRLLMLEAGLLQRAGHAGLSTFKLNPNEFGDIERSDVRVERLSVPRDRFRRQMDELPQRVQKVKQLSSPVSMGRKKLERLRDRQQFEEKTRGKKAIIECSRREFNHLDGFEYPHGVQIPLATEFWEKNKYKGYWIKIRSVQKASSAAKSDGRQWEDYVPDKLNAQVYESLKRLNLRQPTNVQLRCLSSFDSINHLFVAAETGSGKTAAYGAPLITRIMKEKARGRKTKAVILVVTSRLKDQCYSMLNELTMGTGITVCKGVKGDEVSSDWDILISTSGLAEKWLAGLSDPRDVKNIVMDEADMLLDDSFADSLTEIFSIVPVAHSETNGEKRDEGARIVFCSASCPEELECLAEGVVDREWLSYVKSDSLHHLMPNIEMTFIRMRERDKMDRLEKLLEYDVQRGEKNMTMVFCKDRLTASFVQRTLSEKNYPVEGEGIQRILVVTDVASRGVDLPELNHVINYDMPRHTVDFLHRCGRVGRLSSLFTGKVTSFVRTASEVKLTNAIELAARLGRPLQHIETDVSGMISEKRKDGKRGESIREEEGSNSRM